MGYPTDPKEACGDSYRVPLGGPIRGSIRDPSGFCKGSIRGGVRRFWFRA